MKENNNDLYLVWFRILDISHKEYITKVANHREVLNDYIIGSRTLIIQGNDIFNTIVDKIEKLD